MRNILTRLIKLANKLDQQNLHEEADTVDETSRLIGEYEKLRKNSLRNTTRCECKGFGCQDCNSIGYLLSDQIVQDLAKTEYSKRFNSNINDSVQCLFCQGAKKAPAIILLPYSALVRQFPRLANVDWTIENKWENYLKNPNYLMSCIKCNSSGIINKDNLSQNELGRFQQIQNKLEDNFSQKLS